MGFLDDLLLGSGPKLETRSLTTISPEQRAALNQLLGNLGKDPSQYGGEMSAGLTGLENASLSALEERSKQLALPDQNLEAAGASIRDQLDFKKNTADANDYFTNAVQNPALDSFQRSVLPSISRDFGGGSFFSTERQNTEGLARKDLLNSLTAERSKVNLQEFDKARDRALTAAGLTPGLVGAQAQRDQTQMDILKAAGVERQVNQDALDRTYAEFVRQQQERQHNNDQLGNLSTTPTIENIGMTDPGNAGLINTLLGALAGGAGKGLGEGLGGLLSGGLGRLFGQGASAPAGGGASSDATTGAVAGAGAAIGAGAVAGGGIPGAPPTPGGEVSISDMNGNILPSVPFAGGAGLEGLVSSIQPGIQAGIAGTEAANAAALGNIPMPTLGGLTPNAAESAGTAAGAPAGSGGSIVSGLTTALGIGAALYGGYNAVQAAMQGDKKNATLNGAAAGAAAGSIIPGIGTAVGAVVGGLAGLVGASFGDKQQASEAAYGAYKKLPGETSVRNWNQQQVDGAMFEAIKSHSKGSNAAKFQDVSQMLNTFGLKHEDYRGIQTSMKDFIHGVIETAQRAGGLPSDPTALAKLDGQQVYWKVIAPAMAAKVQEKLGKNAQDPNVNAWAGNLQQRYPNSALQNMFADVTDYMVANWSGGGGSVNLPVKNTQPIKGGIRGRMIQ